MKVRLPKEEERTHNLFNSKTMSVNEKFVKGGYIYLLRGCINNLEGGITSKLYREGKKLKSLSVNPESMALAHVLNGNTAFVSATTSYYTAASFSKKCSIYIVKIPVKDIFVFTNELTESLDENEYLIPDYISKDEILTSFKYDELGKIYFYLKDVIGLNILPEDLEVSIEELDRIDYDKLQRYEEFNNGGEGSIFDDILGDIQKIIIKK